MGLRFVKGLGKGQWERIEGARQERPFNSSEDFVERTGLDDRLVTRLAEAGALSGFDPNRRAALWQVKGLARAPKPSLSLKDRDRRPLFDGLDPFETIGWDYRTTGHSPRGHPLAPLRERLSERNLPDARGVSRMRDGRHVNYAGMVISRQRPGTASGVLFMTLEDETGFVNVVVWSRIFEENALLIKTRNFLGISGKLQKQDGVVHLVAETVWDPQARIGVRPASAGSRDFR
jgi:error-prone DNA polymerase